MFLCILQVPNICIHLLSICNDVSDCPSGEDEFLCDLPEECQKGCECLLYAIQCTFLETLVFDALESLENVVFCRLDSIQHVDDGVVSRTLQTFYKHMISFSFSNSYLENICFSGHCSPSLVQHLDFSSNELSALYQDCFCRYKKLKILLLEQNKLLCIDTKTFDKQSHLLLINVSGNLLSSVAPFLALNKQQFLLDIRNNTIESFDSRIAASLTLKNFITNDFRLCCYFEEGLSNCHQTKPDWPFNCQPLLETSSLRVVVIVQMSAIIFCNFLTMLLKYTQLKKFKSRGPKQTKESGAFLFTILLIAGNDSQFGLLLMSILVADQHFGSTYVVKSLAWMSSFPCKSLGVVFLFVVQSTMFLLMFATVAKFVASKFPFKYTFKRKGNISRLVSNGAVLILSLTFTCFLSHTLAEKVLIPSNICSFLGDTKSSITVKCTTLVVALLQITCSSAILIQYVMIFLEITKPKPFTSTEPRRRIHKCSLITSFCVVISCNWLCWIPSAAVSFTSVALPQYPPQLLTWVHVLITPLNALFNPLIFSLYPHLKTICFKQEMNG